MTKEKIEQFIEYNPINYSTPNRINYKNGSHKIGFFDYFDDYEKLKSENKWRFILNKDAYDYQKTKSKDFSVIINGDDLLNIELS